MLNREALAIPGRFEALHGGGVTLAPLAGLEHEIALLLERWRLATSGKGQVVLLVGEPGIGKSRIVEELRAWIEGEAHTRLRYFCSPYHTVPGRRPAHPGRWHRAKRPA